jgi:hypothetical protein
VSTGESCAAGAVLVEKRCSQGYAGGEGQCDTCEIAFGHSEPPEHISKVFRVDCQYALEFYFNL